MTLQDIIHYVEVGAGKRYLRIILPCILILGTAIVRDFRDWRNFSASEAMDSAQLARNIAEGKGYTTLFIRPFSLYLVQQHNQAKADAAADPARIKTMHPDIANPPVYPVALAGLMKILPFHFGVNLNSSFWSNSGYFYRYQPDFLIGIFNLVLFLASMTATFFIAKKIFDVGIARLSAYLMLGCALLWDFTESGLSTMLLLLVFLGLTWCVLKIEELAREEPPDAVRILSWSLAAGMMTGVGALTRYAFGWTIIPVVIFIAWFGGPRKWLHALAAFAVFAVVLAPWIARNVAVCGAPFGTAGYSILAGTTLFPGDQLERSLHPDFSEILMPGVYWSKFENNLRPIFESALFKLGGSWASVFFFAGLMLGFNRPATRRMRYFLLMCLGTFIVVQALGRTSLSDESEINSENLLVLALPLVFIFGAAFFFILLDQMKLPAPQLRYVVIGVFYVLCCLPLLFSLRFKTSPVVFPPYYPPDIQKAAGWMKESELTMSDVPWAVAWYGQRQCVSLTEDDQDQFFALNDYIKPVSALYLTLRTMDSPLVSECFRGGKDNWGHFVLSAVAQNKIPVNFPLRHAPAGSAAIVSGFFVTDADRWTLEKTAGQ
jgi:hypothetical protein